MSTGIYNRESENHDWEHDVTRLVRPPAPLGQHHCKADGDDCVKGQLETGSLLDFRPRAKRRWLRYTNFVGLGVSALVLAISCRVMAQPVSPAIEKIKLPNGQEAWFSTATAVRNSDQFRHYDIPVAPFVDALTIWFQQSKAQPDVIVFSPQEMKDVKAYGIEGPSLRSLDALHSMVSCAPVATTFVPRRGGRGLVLRFRRGKVHCGVTLLKVDRALTREQERAVHDYDIPAGYFGPSMSSFYRVSAPDLHVQPAPEPVDDVDRALFRSVHTRAVHGRMSASAAFSLLSTDSRIYATVGPAGEDDGFVVEPVWPTEASKTDSLIRLAERLSQPRHARLVPKETTRIDSRPAESAEPNCICGAQVDRAHPAEWRHWCMVDGDASALRWAPTCDY